MTHLHVFVFVTFCGILGIFLRRNFLSIIISLLQTSIGINALLGHKEASSDNHFAIYLLVFLIFIFLIFMNAIAMLLIKRRSTLNINELTELRG